MRVAFDHGLAHYDPPPPDQIDDVERLRATDRFRFANVLGAWIEVQDGRGIVGYGYSGGGLLGSTTLRFGPLMHTFAAIGLPLIQHEPERSGDSVRFVQSAGGRTGVPAPRHVRRPPFVQWQAPLVWTTLSLTLHADGSATGTLEGASHFPRHWIYDAAGRLAQKAGLADFTEWWRYSFGPYSPWGQQDSKAVVTMVESALERELSRHVMHGGEKPRVRELEAGAVLVKEGEPGREVFLLLDGILRVDREGERLAEYGPGAVLGERAFLDGGSRTSTLVAVTPCRVAAVDATQLDRDALRELSVGHRREEQEA